MKDRIKARIAALAERHSAISRQIKAERSRPSGGWTDNLSQLKRLRLALKDELQRLRGQSPAPATRRVRT